MLRVFLGDQPSNATKPHQPRVRNRVHEAISELWIHPSVFVAPDDERRGLDLRVLVLIEIGSVHGTRQGQKMFRSVFPDEWREIASDELHWHVLGISDATPEHSLQQRCRSHHAASETEGEPRRASLRLSYVLRRKLFESRSIDQHQLFDALRSIGGELHRDVAAQIDSDDYGSRYAQHCQCRIER